MGPVLALSSRVLLDGIQLDSQRARGPSGFRRFLLRWWLLFNPWLWRSDEGVCGSPQGVCAGIVPVLHVCHHRVSCLLASTTHTLPQSVLLASLQESHRGRVSVGPVDHLESQFWCQSQGLRGGQSALVGSVAFVSRRLCACAGQVAQDGVPGADCRCGFLRLAPAFVRVMMVLCFHRRSAEHWRSERAERGLPDQQAVHAL